MTQPKDNSSFPRTMRELSESDRPREKARLQGIETLSPSELLAILIGSGTPGESVVDLSRRILQRYDGSLHRIAQASVDELMRQFKGIGVAKAITIQAAIRLAQLYSEERFTARQIKSDADAYEIMRNYLSAISHEEFWVVYLNNAKRVIDKVKVAQGGINFTAVDVRIILKHAVDKLASSIILYHNHPSGALTPSVADDNLTKRIKDAADTLGIPVIDHLIISHEGYYSYSSKGKL